MNCIVIEDEPLARKGMQLLIEQMPRLKLLGMFSNALDAGEFLKTTEVDIIFLDIQMPKLNGMDFLKAGSQKGRVIITTAYPQFAVDAFEQDVTDYLVKPIRFERFYKAVKKVASLKNNRSKIYQEDDYIFIRTERKYIRSNFNEIDYIEGLKDYVIVHCGPEKHTVAANLKTIQGSLPEASFIRVNKSFIINLAKIKSVDHEWIVINSKKIPIGLNFKQEVLKLVKSKKLLKR